MDREIQLTNVIFVDREYSFKHPHMIHRHEEVLELLYIASESGRYLVGNHEYAVTAGDFVICNANVPHGEDPFQEHHIQTYCLVYERCKVGSRRRGATNYFARQRKCNRCVVAGDLSSVP